MVVFQTSQWSYFSSLVCCLSYYLTWHLMILCSPGTRTSAQPSASFLPLNNDYHFVYITGCLRWVKLTEIHYSSLGRHLLERVARWNRELLREYQIRWTDWTRCDARRDFRTLNGMCPLNWLEFDCYFRSNLLFDLNKGRVLFMPFYKSSLVKGTELSDLNLASLTFTLISSLSYTQTHTHIHVYINICYF